MTMNSIQLSQTLHGYKDGHKLLANSCHLDEYAIIEMARMSDLMPQHLDERSSYICAYPLKSINKYVFAKTWSAFEMRRPGCVWTHSLLLDYSTVAKIQDISALLEIFERPGFDAFHDYDFDGYESEILVDLGPETLFSGGDEETREFAAKILSKIYFSNQKRIIIQASLDEDTNITVPMMVWNQMPPRIRRDFVFCTSGGPRSLTPSAEVALIITNESVPNGSSHEDELPGLSSIVDDLFNLPQSDVRAFVSRYDVDAKNAREAVPKLMEVAELLFVGDLEEGLTSSSQKIVNLFPENGDCRLLKREYLTGALVADVNLSDKERFQAALNYVLPNFKYLSQFEDFDLIKKFVNAVISLNCDLSSIIKSCIGGEKGSLGYRILWSLCDKLPIEKIASIRFDAEVKLIIASLNPLLLEETTFWSTFDTRLSYDDIELLNNFADLEVLAEGFLAGKMYAPFRALMRENSVVFMPHLIAYINKQSNSEKSYLIAEFRDERARILEYLAKSDLDDFSLVNVIGDDIFYSTYPEISAAFWVYLFSKIPNATKNIEPSLAFVMFEQASWVGERSKAVSLYRLSFPILHNVTHSNFSNADAVIKKIRSIYPADYSSHSSDVASRLRRKLCEFFEGSNQYDEFIACAENDTILAQLFASMSSLWRGNDWLKGLLSASDSGIVHLTTYQRNMVLAALPRPRRGLFDWW
jgi:hypothetical protein